MEKRYAIIRVDDRCPVENEEEIYLLDRVKMFPCFLDKRLSCKNCRYGDTQEQLENKVLTAIERAITKFENGEIVFDEKRALAKIIVEFLGVK